MLFGHKLIKSKRSIRGAAKKKRATKRRWRQSCVFKDECQQSVLLTFLSLPVLLRLKQHFSFHVTNRSHIYIFLNHDRTSGRKVCSLAESLAGSDSFASETVQMVTHDCIKPFYFFQMSWLLCSSLAVLQPSSCPVTYLCFGIINTRKMLLIKLLSAVVRFDIKPLIISLLPPRP